MSHVRIRFDHGLGDCVNFAHTLKSWISRGHKVTVGCRDGSRHVFQIAGCDVVPVSTPDLETHRWLTLTDVFDGDGKPLVHGEYQGHDWVQNKIGGNLTTGPMPRIADEETLWNEAVTNDLRMDAALHFGPFKDSAEKADKIMDELGPGPVLMLHGKGVSCKLDKDLHDDFLREMCRRILDKTDCTILMLDSTGEMPRFNHGRVRHLYHEWRWSPDLPGLFHLLKRTTLFVGCDSGPLHFLKFTHTPGLGLWRRHNPAHYCLPRLGSVHAAGMMHEPSNRYRRIPFQILCDPGYRSEGELCPHFVMEMISRMVEPAVYLNYTPADVFFRHYISRTNGNNDWSSIADRQRSFGEVFKRLRKVPSPTIVETGTIRAGEDWYGGGYSTYLFGMYLRLKGRGHLDSVDVDAKNAEFSQLWTYDFRNHVTVHNQDSHKFLADWPRGKQIDLLYLDSMDLWVDGHPQHCLKEAQLALESSAGNLDMILIDDTMWTTDGGLWGKGAITVPYLQSMGYNVVYSGYQTLLERKK